MTATKITIVSIERTLASEPEGSPAKRGLAAEAIDLKFARRCAAMDIEALIDAEIDARLNGAGVNVERVEAIRRGVREAIDGVPVESRASEERTPGPRSPLPDAITEDFLTIFGTRVDEIGCWPWWAIELPAANVYDRATMFPTFLGGFELRLRSLDGVPPKCSAVQPVLAVVSPRLMTLLELPIGQPLRTRDEIWNFVGLFERHLPDRLKDSLKARRQAVQRDKATTNGQQRMKAEG